MVRISFDLGEIAYETSNKLVIILLFLPNETTWTWDQQNPRSKTVVYNWNTVVSAISWLTPFQCQNECLKTKNHNIFYFKTSNNYFTNPSIISRSFVLKSTLENGRAIDRILIVWHEWRLWRAQETTGNQVDEVWMTHSLQQYRGIIISDSNNNI